MGNLSRNLSRSEFSCKCGCGFDTVDIKLVEAVQGCVDYFQAKYREKNVRVLIISGCRCEAHNRREGGHPKSYHVKAKAADLALYFESGGFIEPDEVADYFEAEFPYSSGIGRYNGRTHYDCQPKKKRWDLR